jgi:hypothetical protein
MQLDFISYGQIAKSEQFNLFTDDLKNAIKPKASISYGKTEKFFNNLSATEIAEYKNYWASVKPTDTSEVFKRYLFAFMSVHTSWESNLNGYNAIKNWIQWINNSELLKSKLEASRVGLHNNRTRFVTNFSQLFWSNPKNFNKIEGEGWVEYRNRLEKQILGLGLAKTSFALEMIYPNECEVTCMDTHLFQLYGLNQTRDAAQYEAIEKHWISMCKMWNVPSYVARCIWWDKNQNKTDSRYWSYVLEN